MNLVNWIKLNSKNQKCEINGLTYYAEKIGTAWFIYRVKPDFITGDNSLRVAKENFQYWLHGTECATIDLANSIQMDIQEYLTLPEPRPAGIAHLTIGDRAFDYIAIGTNPQIAALVRKNSAFAHVSLDMTVSINKPAPTPDDAPEIETTNPAPHVRITKTNGGLMGAFAQIVLGGETPESGVSIPLKPAPAVVWSNRGALADYQVFNTIINSQTFFLKKTRFRDTWEIVDIGGNVLFLGELETIKSRFAESVGHISINPGKSSACTLWQVYAVYGTEHTEWKVFHSFANDGQEAIKIGQQMAIDRQGMWRFLTWECVPPVGHTLEGETAPALSFEFLSHDQILAAVANYDTPFPAEIYVIS